MSEGHGGLLFVPRRSPMHGLPPQCKIVSMAMLVLAIVATPREQVWAYGLYAAVLVALLAAARLPLALVARRMTIELPFVAFALLLPFVAGGPRRQVGPVALSADGLWGAWNILAKGTLGVGLALVLTMTTTVPDVVRGLERLRLPSALIAMLTFMVRYIDVISGELARMRIARVSRGDDPRWPWQARAVAHTAGTLFVRSYERGERVFVAMQSRGYAGQMPAAGGARASARQWLQALVPVVVVTAVAAMAWRAQP